MHDSDGNQSFLIRDRCLVREWMYTFWCTSLQSFDRQNVVYCLWCPYLTTISQFGWLRTIVKLSIFLILRLWIPCAVRLTKPSIMLAFIDICCTCWFHLDLWWLLFLDLFHLLIVWPECQLVSIGGLWVGDVYKCVELHTWLNYLNPSSSPATSWQRCLNLFEGYLSLED